MFTMRSVLPIHLRATAIIAALALLPLHPAIASPIAGGDIFEPDTCATPRPVTAGSVVSGFVNPSNDQDYFSITLACGDMLRADVLPGNGSVGLIIALFGPGDPTCTSSIGGVRPPTNPVDAQPLSIFRPAKVAGTYTLQVQSVGQFGGPESHFLGPYSVAFSVTRGPCTPPAEPVDSDSCASAMSLVDGSVVRRAIGVVGDRDFYQVATSCGDQLLFCVTPTSGTWAAQIDRYAIGDAACAGGVFLAHTIPGATLTYVTPNIAGSGDGIFRFRVSSRTVGGTGSYTLAVAKSNLGYCNPDASEPNDTRFSCRPLPGAGSSEAHTIAPSTNEDWSCIRLAQGERITVGTHASQAVGRRTSTFLSAFDDSGAYLDSDRSAGMTLYSRLRFAAPEDGEYAFQVRINAPIPQPGSYDLRAGEPEPLPPLFAESSQSTTPAGTLVTAMPEADAFEYTLQVGADSLLDISMSGRNLALTNESFALLDLPFPFEYFGNTYTQVIAGDNGFLTFDELFSSSGLTNACPFPDTGSSDPKSTIAAFWDALDPSLPGAGVFVETLGVAPTRTFVVQWKGMGLTSGGGSHSFEVLLHEDGNAIEVRYGAMAGAPGSSGNSATIGIQDETGSRGLAHSCNVAGGAAAGQSLTFRPPAGRVVYPTTETYLTSRDLAPLDDISAIGTGLTLADNGSASVPLPFSFNFYGEVKTSVIVSANGLLRFAAGPDTARDCPLPVMGGVKGLIAPFWGDWNPARGGSVTWAVDGPVGARRFIALWKNVPHSRATTSTIPGGAHTFEAILHEGTNAIEFRYGALAGAPESDGNAATIGLESSDERRGTAVSCSSPGQVTQGDRWTFTPASLAPEVEWRNPDDDTLLSTAPSYFMPAEGRCNVRLVARGTDPESLAPAVDQRIVEVPDIAPPVVAAGTGDIHCVWPPNHADVTFALQDFAPDITDNCNSFNWLIASCVADPPDEDGDACVVAADGSSVTLRAERPGSARDGRRYAIRVIATDAVGNSGEEVLVGYVLVPHDQRDHPSCLRPHAELGRSLPPGPRSLR